MKKAKKDEVAVSNARGVRTLHVGGEAIQSAMRIDDPYALALDYTRCMMSFLLFHPEPRRALMIGLGGGSLAKFFHRNLRKTAVRVVELDGDVVAAARQHFALPADDARLSVEIGDGVEALAPECCDVLVLDAFQDELHVPRLASAEFYDGAFLALTEPGALVVNFMNDDPKFDLTLQRLERAFGGAVLAMPALYDPNILVFALKGAPERVEWAVLRTRAESLETRLGLPFNRYVSRLRAMNRCTAEELIIAG
ncbi:MAG TPA: spermidine synthase [Burkholderiales bacterium]|nr:spermidine synthase [Burkholderiales bacterium]